ncbi:hypothetical protein HG530_009009 [Fusarium avenaceum]|nr:hypothetical protein HG530_009009 [Fusarium avenaceum]
MAPSDEEIEQALLDATYEVYQAFPDETTVNKVRKQTEENLSLEDGFFSSGDWKKKSKDLVKERAEKLGEGWVPDNKKEDGSDEEEEKQKSAGVKRSSPDAESPQPKSKRQKRAPKSETKTKAKPKPKKAAKKVESDDESNRSESSELSELSEVSEVSEMSEEEQPQKKRKRAAPKRAAPKKAAPKKATQKRKSKTADSDVEDEEVALDSDAEQPLEKDDEAENEEPAGEKETTPSKAQNSNNEEKLAVNEDENKPAVDEEEEYSDVIDEPVKPKRKKKEKEEGGSKPAKAPKAPKAVVKKSTATDDPSTEEIKRLQGYLTKCGVRKLWHNELKQYGDDAKAKIRHLKKMLTDVGMDGRFSEAKAREIKERRELLAEVESAQEMSALWGVEGRGRASRSKSKTAKVIESEGSDVENNDGDGKDDEDDEEETYAARRKRARADLAFLVGPRLVHDSGTICVSLLKQDLVLPLGHIGRVDIASRLTAETSAGFTGWQTVNGWHVDAGAGVDLESWLGAVDFEVDAGASVVSLDVELEGLASGVEGHGGRLLVEDEAVVDVGLLRTEGEGLVGGDAGEGLDLARGDEIVADGEVVGCGEGHLCVGDGLLSAGVEVRVVGHVDDGLISAIDELGLVLHGKNSSFLAVDLLRTRGVSDGNLNSTGISLLAILAGERKGNALAALKAVYTGDLTGANRLGAVPDTAAPANLAAVEVVLSVVGGESDLLAIEAVDASSLDAVGDSADGYAKVRVVVLLVVFLRGEALDDVDAVDDEGLDNSAEGQERDGSVGHDEDDLTLCGVNKLMEVCGLAVSASEDDRGGGLLGGLVLLGSQLGHLLGFTLLGSHDVRVLHDTVLNNRSVDWSEGVRLPDAALGEAEEIVLANLPRVLVVLQVEAENIAMLGIGKSGDNGLRSLETHTT